MLNERLCKSRHTMVEGLEQLDSLENHLESTFVCNQSEKHCHGGPKILSTIACVGI